MSSKYKFKYLVIRENGHTFSKIFTLEQAEGGTIAKWLSINIVGDSELQRLEFTGKHDRKEQEIYEGDKLQIGKCSLRVTVFWDNEVGAWQVTNPHKENGGEALLSQYANDYHNIVEVIDCLE